MHLRSRTGRAVLPSHGGRLLAVLARAALSVAVLASPVLAQEAEPTPPLSKSQLIRLVTSPTYTQSEIAEIVAASCLSFEPTDRDLADLSSLGASDPVLAAVRGCDGGDGPAGEAQAAGEERAGEGEQQEAPGAAAAAAEPTLGRLALDSERLWGEVETVVNVTAVLRRDGRPVPGQRLILRGSGAVVGGAGSDVTATTDVTGAVVFSVPTGTAARTYPFSVVAGNGRLEGEGTLELMVHPGPPARADLSPAELAPRSDGQPSSIEVTIRDRFGNAIPDAVVALSLPASAGGATLPGTTDARGVASFAVVTSELEEGERLPLLSGGTAIGEVVVGSPAAELAAEKREAPAPGDSVVAADVARAGDADGAVASGAGAAAAEGRPSGADAAAVDSFLTEGREAQAAKQYDRAELYYRQAFDIDPNSAATQRALGDLSMIRGQPENAMLWYQAAVNNEPDDAQLWLGLARARAEAGYSTAANEALHKVLELDPDNVEARQMLTGVGPRQPLLNASIWGGNTFDNSRSAGLRSAELIVWPLPVLSVWGRYDNSLALYEWALVRGQDDIEGFYGGAGLEWGSRRFLSTRFEIGRREPPGSSGVYQNFYHLEQGVRVTSGVNAIRVAAGGYLGRWYDRDDWQIYGKAEIPTGPVLTMRPAIYVGEGVGTAFAEIGRVAADEFRGYLTFDFRPIRAVRLQPTFGLGSVSSEDSRLDGTLVDALFQLSVGSGVATGELFLRYQDAPGVESFAVVAIGLTVGVPRGGF